MGFFSFNYEPKDFKKGDQDKTLPEILEMNPSKVEKDFFKIYEKEIVEVGLKEETLEAIRLLSDLRDKTLIYDKCYKTKRASPMPQAMPMPQPMPATMYVEEDQRPLIAQAGGRRRTKKRSMKKRSMKKRSMKKSKKSKKAKKSKKTRRSRKH